MRILMVCPELPRADCPGSMAPCARQIESLRALGHAIDVVDMQGIPKLKYLQVIPRLRRLAKRAEVIHAHFGYCGWLARWAPLWSGSNAPLVISFMGDDLLGTPYNARGDLEWFSKLMVRANRRLATKADQIIVKSQQMADVLAPTDAHVIPNGVDTDVFRPLDRDDARRQLGLPADASIVLFPGSPDNPRKGHALAKAAVEAASGLLERRIELLPLWGVQHDQVALYMNACNAMLMTSLIEGSPNVVKEAMACNTAVIGVPVGDVHQLLDGVQGCERCPRDVDALAAAIVRVFGSRTVAARDAIVDRGLELTSVAHRITAVYENALAWSSFAPRKNAKPRLSRSEQRPSEPVSPQSYRTR
ncbi:glycosyltransferase family 4 protein [Roseimaritima ulvae]|uniref:Teichuronic acid biosynthesis glycosyltransferase TuaC n=1 Tax=Roseimaritima ulvae TaxID=980254 RepID=A0A5B9QIP6_9BACT|nr:glycosyltransferase family 4 protein [Roseimaritima ulvae]QEG38977.1 Putative teichuronic acid biosynthesis glycosyltransferase TuaC [Roseimaritima ulvae]